VIEATIYKALGDPIRLEIVKRLAITSTSTVGDILTNLGISRQGARKQLQVLVNANVVHHVLVNTPKPSNFSNPITRSKCRFLSNFANDLEIH